MSPRVARGWHGIVALLVLVAIVAQLIVAVRVPATPPSTAVGLLRGTSLVGRVIRVLSFFTIQSNILTGVVSAQLAIRPDRDGRGWRALRLAALVGIAVTGIVYSTVLARIHQPNGPLETTINTLVHYVVPVLAVVGWAVFGPRPRIDGRTVVLSLAFPVLWLGYTLVRGAIWGWYPYPFLDVPTHGYPRVVINALVVTVVLGGVAALVYAGDRRLRPAPDRREGLSPGRRQLRRR